MTLLILSCCACSRPKVYISPQVNQKYLEDVERPEPLTGVVKTSDLVRKLDEYRKAFDKCHRNFAATRAALLAVSLGRAEP